MAGRSYESWQGNSLVICDADLVARVKCGEADAFRSLVDRYQRSVFAMALAQLRDRHEAEDIAQATFLLAYRRISTLTDNSKFGPWLMKIARRQIIDVARRRKIPVTTDAD